MPTCAPGPEVIIVDNLPASQVSYTWTGSASDDPLPYSSYELVVGAANSVGAVNSTFSNDIFTQSSGMDKFLWEWGRRGKEGEGRREGVGGS